MLGSRATSEDHHISSFQAFCTSLAARVGTGNLAGVAVAIYTGGPGAVFWMWLIALLGMSTSFVENTLAQIYKSNNHDGTYRGARLTTSKKPSVCAGWVSRSPYP